MASLGQVAPRHKTLRAILPRKGGRLDAISFQMNPHRFSKSVRSEYPPPVWGGGKREASAIPPRFARIEAGNWKTLSAQKKRLNEGPAEFGEVAASELIRASCRLEQMSLCALLTGGSGGNSYTDVHARCLEDKDLTPLTQSRSTLRLYYQDSSH